MHSELELAEYNSKVAIVSAEKKRLLPPRRELHSNFASKPRLVEECSWVRGFRSNPKFGGGVREGSPLGGRGAGGNVATTEE